jgi:Na+-driven multidrug efflux pump
MILMSFSTVFLNAVTGTGNSAVTFAIEVSAIILYGIYVYVVVNRLFLPIYIGWMSEWVYWSSIFAACYLYLRSGRWKKTIL